MQASHLPLSMRSRQPRARLHPVQLPRLAPRPRGLNRGSALLSKLVSSCPLPSAARYPAISDKAWEVKKQAQVRSAASQSHDNLVNRGVAMPRGIGACLQAGMGEVSGQPIQKSSLAEAWAISKCGWEMKKAMCLRFSLCSARSCVNVQRD